MPFMASRDGQRGVRVGLGREKKRANTTVWDEEAEKIVF
jgi:hypothetical protein